MKQFEAHDVTVGGYDFHIFPFPAFKAANISAELTSVLSPIIPAIALLRGNDGGDLLDMDISKITEALGLLDGDKLESILRKLLVQNRNVSYEDKNKGTVEQVTQDVLDEIFCGEFENLIMLAFEVVKVNYGGFFKSLGLQSGNAGDQQAKMTN